MTPLIYLWIAFSIVAFSIAVDFMFSRGRNALFRRKSLRVLASLLAGLMIITLFVELYFFYPILISTSSDTAAIIAQTHVASVFTITVIPLILSIVALRIIDSAIAGRRDSLSHNNC